jgi:hypothetical protein
MRECRESKREIGESKRAVEWIKRQRRDGEREKG